MDNFIVRMGQPGLEVTSITGVKNGGGADSRSCVLSSTSHWDGLSALTLSLLSNMN